MSYALNPRARYDYDILETLEAGVVLTGHEVKAIKAGKVSIKGAYVKILGGELWLIGATVSPYQPGNVPVNYDQSRSRKLLVRHEQLKRLIGASEEKGNALVPLQLYGKGGFIKLEFALARGKKKYDKRDTIRERDFERTRARALRQSQR